MKASKSAVFLFELMIVILVFVLAAAICSQIFAGSYRMSRESQALTMTSIHAQTMAERFKAGDNAISPMYFDSSWHEVDAADEQQIYYSVELEDMTAASSVSGMRWAVVRVLKVGEAEPVFTLNVKKYDIETVG